MKRREAFKKLGIAALVGGTGMIFMNSCNNDKSEEVVAAAPMATTPIPEVKSEREKLIINRIENTFADPENPTDAELKHTPEITLGDKDDLGNTLVKVTIGQKGIIHPATKEHWIDYIKVFVNEQLVAETEFNNGGIRGFGNYYIALNPNDQIMVESGCNLHGIYHSSITV